MEVFSEHLKKEHFLAKIDARIKILMGMALLAMILTYHGFLFPASIAVISVVLCMLMKIPIRIFMLRFSEPIFLAVVVVLLKFFFSGTEALFSFHIAGMEIVGRRDGLVEGLMIATRIIGAVSLVAVIGFSTPFTEFMAALSWLRVPKTFIEILMFAYRYIFVLLDEAMVIYSAQKNRLGYSNIRRGLSSFGVLAGSLTLKAFDHSQNTTVAMVQRGYDGNIPLLKHKSFKLSEIAASIFFVAAMGVLWKI